jgi:hypothetical protein
MTSGLRIVAVVRMSPQDVAGGQRYEDLVLDLLPEIGGRVERRLRTHDGLTEVQELWLPSRESMEQVLAHPARLAAREALGSASPVTDIYEVDEVVRAG